jgi:hypothetical protein
MVMGNGELTDKEIVFEFFSLFSRFEYALKRGGFLRKGKRAKPDWEAYADTLRESFSKVNDEGFKRACAYLKGQPPEKQVVIQHKLDWEATTQESGESEERYVLRLVRTVRNNLFHGGKYPYTFGPTKNDDRNRRLLKTGRVILELCFSLSADLRRIFFEDESSAEETA